MVATARAVRVAAVGDVPAGGLHRVVVDGRPIVLADLAGTLVALAGACPHAGGPLDEGHVADGRLRCPWHGATFDLGTGSACDGPARKPLRRYPVRIEGEAILLTLD